MTFVPICGEAPAKTIAHAPIDVLRDALSESIRRTRTPWPRYARRCLQQPIEKYNDLNNWHKPDRPLKALGWSFLP